jgi:hypothetical protein
MTTLDQDPGIIAYREEMKKKYLDTLAQRKLLEDRLQEGKLFEEKRLTKSAETLSKYINQLETQPYDILNIDRILSIFKDELTSCIDLGMAPEKFRGVVMKLVIIMSSKTCKYDVLSTGKMHMRIMDNIPTKLKLVLKAVGLDEDIFEVSRQMDTSNDEALARSLSQPTPQVSAPQVPAPHVANNDETDDYMLNMAIMASLDAL